MKSRLLAAFLALGVLATSNAFASRARLLVMGTGDAGGAGVLAGGGNGGSLYYDDAYNVFYNPAYVNDFKNWAIIEKSNSNQAGLGDSAMGGMVTSIANFNLGLFFNRVAALEGVDNMSAAQRNSMRPIDLFIGSDMGVKWGIGMTWSTFRRTTTDPVLTDTDMVLRAGVAVADFEPFINYRLTSMVDNADQNARTKNRDMTIGLRYRFGEWTPYAAYRATKRVNNAGDILEGVGTNRTTRFGGGVGRTSALAEGARLMYSLSYWRLLNGGTAGADSRSTVVPIDLAVEADASSWLTLRAGVNYALAFQTNGVTTQNVPTTARVGATFHVGKADVDFAVGAANDANGVAEDGDQIDSQVLGISQGLFSALSVSYRW